MGKNFSKAINISSWLALVVTILYVFLIILMFAKDIPYWDEWDCMPPYNFSHIISFHNGHQIFFTKLLQQILYWTTDWNIKLGIMINFLIYIATTFSVYKITKFYAPNLSYLPILFLPMFSCVPAENFFWCFQSSFHFMVLFGALAIWFGFVKNNTSMMMLFLIFSVFSLNITFALGIFLVYFVKEILSKKYLWAVLNSFIMIFLAIMFINAVPVDNHGPLVFDFVYIVKYFSIFIGKVLFGRQLPLMILSVLLLSIVCVLIFGVYKQIRLKKVSWGLYALLSASLVSAVAIPVSRSFQLYMISSRHTEVALFLLPVIISLFYIYKEEFLIKFLRYFCLIIVLIATIGYSSKFVYYDYFKYNNRNASINCIKDYYSGKNNGCCPTSSPHNIADELDFAKQNNHNFVRSIYRKDNIVKFIIETLSW